MFSQPRAVNNLPPGVPSRGSPAFSGSYFTLDMNTPSLGYLSLSAESSFPKVVCIAIVSYLFSEYRRHKAADSASFMCQQFKYTKSRPKVLTLHVHSLPCGFADDNCLYGSPKNCIVLQSYGSSNLSALVKYNSLVVIKSTYLEKSMYRQIF